MDTSEELLWLEEALPLIVAKMIENGHCSCTFLSARGEEREPQARVRLYGHIYECEVISVSVTVEIKKRLANAPLGEAECM